MDGTDKRFWPFLPRTSIFLSIATLVGLLFILMVLKIAGVWPISERSEGAVLIGILLFSLLPIALALLDVVIERGVRLKYRELEIYLSQVSNMGMREFTLPTNIGFSGKAVHDSSATEILGALRHATACEVVVIDLEDGEAWWRTRLLVLLAGAVRLGKPHKIVFVGKDGGVDRCFQGWGYSMELLPLLLKEDHQYLRSYHAAQAAARQWELVEPVNPPDPAAPDAPPQKPFSIQQGLALDPGERMAFDSGLPNELLAERLLYFDLGQKIESKEDPRTISLNRLNDMFRSVLYKAAIDTSWPTERQVTEFFDSDLDYLAITQKGKYLSLTSRLSVLNAFVRSMVEGKRV